MLPASMCCRALVGVLTIISGFSTNNGFCADNSIIGEMSIQRTSREHLYVKSQMTLWICVQSSRLGDRIRAFVSCFVAICLEFRIFCITGIAKAAVLPEPVLARTNTSLPFINRGIAFSWMRVGVIHPSFAIP